MKVKEINKIAKKRIIKLVNRSRSFSKKKN